MDKVRSNDTVLGRSILFIDLDGVTTRQVRQVTRSLIQKGFAFFAHGTSSDRHQLKGGDDVRAVRYLIPTNRPMDADEIWHVQHSFLNRLGLHGMDGVDLTACQRALALLLDAEAVKAGVSNMHVWAQCTEAEANARSALTRATGG